VTPIDFLALATVYPEFKWESFRFYRTDKGFWKDPNNVRAYLDRIGKTLGVSTLDDWYRIDPQSVLKIDSRLLKKISLRSGM
jgi:hypothetical protein